MLSGFASIRLSYSHEGKFLKFGTWTQGGTDYIVVVKCHKYSSLWPHVLWKCFSFEYLEGISFDFNSRMIC